MTELDNITVKQDEYENEVKKEINKQEQEVKDLLLEIDFLLKSAKKQSLELPSIPYHILTSI